MRTMIFPARLLVLTAFSVLASSSVVSQSPATQADLDYQTAAVLYMQKAAEYRALAYQAFNIARLRLDADMDRKNVKRLPRSERKRPRAIVVDIDETVLDNSPSQARGIKHGRPFNADDWYAWGRMRKAKAIPGAVEFLNYAVSKGVKVFFVSNRDEIQKPETIDNLKSAGFPEVTSDNVMLRQTDANGRHVSTKEPRRLAISTGYRIVLMIGDNLDDFSEAFERKNFAERFAATDKAKPRWGERWIVLPNAMYGTWENAIYDYKAATMSEKEKAERRAAALELP